MCLSMLKNLLEGMGQVLYLFESGKDYKEQKPIQDMKDYWDDIEFHGIQM